MKAIQWINIQFETSLAHSFIVLPVLLTPYNTQHITKTLIDLNNAMYI